MSFLSAFACWGISRLDFLFLGGYDLCVFVMGVLIDFEMDNHNAELQLATTDTQVKSFFRNCLRKTERALFSGPLNQNSRFLDITCSFVTKII